MYKLILGVLIPLAAMVVACGGDDESTPATTKEPTSAATQSTDGGDATDGKYASSELPISVTVTTGEGWEVPADADTPDLFAVAKTGSPIGYIDFLQPTQVYNRTTTTESKLADPPADYVAWFNENPFLSIADTQDVTVGGLSGTRLEITSNSEDDFGLFKLSDGADYTFGYLTHVFVTVLDSGGSQLLAICGTENSGDIGKFEEICDEVLATGEFGT